VKYILVITFIVLSVTCQSQLKMENIMSGNEFIGHQPYNINWSPDNKTVYFRWKHNEEVVAPYYEVKGPSKTASKIDNNETVCKTVNGFVSDDKNENIYFQKNGNLYKWGAKKSTLILQKATHFSIVKVLSNNRIILRENNNLFVYQPNTGSYIQLIDFKKGPEPNDAETQSYLENQQDELFEIVRQNKIRTAAKNEFKDEINLPSVPKYYLNNKTLGWVKITPDLSHIIFRVDEYPKNENTHIENHVTSNGYTKSTNARAKVGGENPKHELFIMNLETESVIPVSSLDLPSMYDKPAFLNDSTKADNPRDVIYTDAWISEKGNNCVV